MSLFVMNLTPQQDVFWQIRHSDENKPMNKCFSDKIFEILGNPSYFFLSDVSPFRFCQRDWNEMKPTWRKTWKPKGNVTVKAQWMFMCYNTYCKNNRHNHSPTWKFVTTLKIAMFPVSTPFQTAVTNIQCFSPGVWFSWIYKSSS